MDMGNQANFQNSYCFSRFRIKKPKNIQIMEEQHTLSVPDNGRKGEFVVPTLQTE